LLFTVACKRENNYVYKLPEQNDDGWDISSLQDSQIDSLPITQLVSKIKSNDFENIDALLIVKDGQLILDEYFNGYNKDKKHKLWSCTKSFSSALVGIAVEEGKIKSEKDQIINYLGSYSNGVKENIKAISIEDVLKMGTGLEWKGDLAESGMKLPYAKDMVAHTLQLPQESKPGTKFQYSSANSMLLAPIIYNATGKQADEFARETLFKELGIVNYEWNKQAEFWTKTAGKEVPVKKPNIKYEHDYSELTNTATGLWMVPRDMGKLGQLYLDKGKWKGKQVIPSSWVEKSTTEQIPNSKYGLHWKLMQVGNQEVFYASGFGLQNIFVFPKLQMVVVFTQNWYHDQREGESQMMKILEEYILKGVKNA